MDERMNEQTDEKQVMCTISSNGYHCEISLDRRLFPFSSKQEILIPTCNISKLI